MPDNKEDPQESMFQKTYDKEIQHDIEFGLAEIMRSMREYGRTKTTDVIFESEMLGLTISSIERILQLCKNLYYKYHEDVEKQEKGKEKTEPKLTEGFAELRSLEESLIVSSSIDIANTIRWLKVVQEHEIKDIAVKHKLMDRTQEKQPWEREVKERFFLNEVSPEEWTPHQEYLDSLKRKWKKEVFLESAYMVLKNGDIVKLISGINNSGKTWTSIPQARTDEILFKGILGKAKA